MVYHVRLARRRRPTIIVQDGDTTTLRTNNGGRVLIDTEDCKRIMDHAWNVRKSGNNHYCYSSIFNGDTWATVQMHRLIMNATKGVFIDHINGDGLDNRKRNLRLCTGGQNIQNSRRRRDNTSGYKGVHRRYNNKWQARIIIDGRRVSLGHYSTKEAAALAYDTAAQSHYGEFAKVNFPMR